MRFRTLVLFLAVGLFGFTGIHTARAQWVQTSGPSGGTISAMAVLGANTPQATLFAGTGAGVFRSTDNGAHWVSAMPGLTNASVSALAVLDTDVFAATANGVYRSTDKGRSWRSVNSGLGSSGVSLFGVMGSKGSPELLFGAPSYAQGIFRSTNRGTSWIEVDSGLPNNASVRAFAAMGTELFAGSYDGVYRSSDSGKTWMVDTVGLSSYPEVLSFAVSGNNIYVGTYTGIFRSTDSGATWTPASTGTEGSDVNSLVASGPNLYAGGEYGFFQSSDEGQTWVPANSGLTSMAVVEAIAILDTAESGMPATLFAGTLKSGIFESTNGGADWFSANTGLIISNVSSLAVLGPDLFAGTDNDVFLSNDDGASWQPLGVNNGGLSSAQISSLVTDGQTLFAVSSYNGTLLVSSDSGVTWMNPNSGNYSSVSINALFPVVESSGTILFAGTSAGIFQSTDEGTTWIDASTGLPANDLYVYSFAQQNGNVYCGTTSGGVFFSSDSGEIWNDISPSITASQGSNIQALAVSGSILFAGMNGLSGLGTGSGVLQSSGNGTNWMVDGGVNGNVAALLTVGPNIFAATDAGISVSTNSGAVWSDASDGLNGAAVTALAIRGPYLYAGTTGSGVWRRPLSEMIDVSSVTPNASLATTEENYPNPFTTQTTIPFTLSQSGHVTVTIFNMLGNRVVTLANQDMGAGPHEVVWNAATAAPGMYLYHITTAEGTESHTIVREEGGR